MAKGGAILILSQVQDGTARHVAGILERRGEHVAIVDTAELPGGSRFFGRFPTPANGWEGELRLDDGRAVDFGDVKSIWFRRPAQFPEPPGASPGEAAFALRELRLGFGGLLRAEHAYWMNHFERMVSADYKPFQLRVASEVGLRIPATVVGNDVDVLCEFVAGCGGRAICKPLGWGNVFREDGWGSALVGEDDLRRRPPVGTVYQLQEPVPKRTELRVTYVDGRLFVCEVHGLHTEEGRLDWRKLPTHEQHLARFDGFPDDVAACLVELHERLGLTYGAADFIVTPERELVFLETNPNGEWGWLEARLGIPIGAEIAACLGRGRS